MLGERITRGKRGNGINPENRINAETESMQSGKKSIGINTEGTESTEDTEQLEETDRRNRLLDN